MNRPARSVNLICLYLYTVERVGFKVQGLGIGSIYRVYDSRCSRTLGQGSAMHSRYAFPEGSLFVFRSMSLVVVSELQVP